MSVLALTIIFFIFNVVYWSYYTMHFKALSKCDLKQDEEKYLPIVRMSDE